MSFEDSRSDETEELTSLHLSSLRISNDREGGRAWVLEFIREEPQRFLVHKHSGKVSQTLGWMDGGRYYLSIPEGLFLLESGRANLLESSSLNSTDIHSDISGVPQIEPIDH